MMFTFHISTLFLMGLGCMFVGAFAVASSCCSGNEDPFDKE